jgi:hypothetical protein
MNDESLQSLFNEIKNTPPATSVHDVSAWLDAAPIIAPKTNGSIYSLSVKTITMTSLFVMAIAGTIYFTSAPEKNDTSVSKTPEKEKTLMAVKKSVGLADSKRKENIVTEILLAPASEAIGASRINAEILNDSLAKNQNKTQIPAYFEPKIDTVVNPVYDKNEKTAGSWKSINDSLYIDTIFNGVKKLIFNGHISHKTVIAGSKRNNISMRYSYNYKAKGLIVGNSQCEVIYKKIDSVLTIQVTRKSAVNIGVSITKLSSNITFEIPESIAIEINTSYGDIEIRDLVDNVFQVKTAYGDIKATSVVGTPTLRTNFGDIILDRIKGNIETATAYGDIKGLNITALESVLLKSNYGDIDLQFTNPISDCKLELKTSYGKLKIKRNDLEIESAKRLTFGTGQVKVIATTSYGNVIVK